MLTAVIAYKSFIYFLPPVLTLVSSFYHVFYLIFKHSRRQKSSINQYLLNVKKPNFVRSSCIAIADLQVQLLPLNFSWLAFTTGIKFSTLLLWMSFLTYPVFLPAAMCTHLRSSFSFPMKVLLSVLPETQPGSYNSETCEKRKLHFFVFSNVTSLRS